MKPGFARLSSQCCIYQPHALAEPGELRPRDGTILRIRFKCKNFRPRVSQPSHQGK
jgi:hypothetical protein